MNNWKPVKSNSLPNLNVLTVNGKEIGFIEKPKDSKTCKNLWRSFIGIGDKATFLGHMPNKNLAKSLVEANFDVYGEA